MSKGIVFFSHMGSKASAVDQVFKRTKIFLELADVLPDTSLLVQHR